MKPWNKNTDLPVIDKEIEKRKSNKAMKIEELKCLQ
jgi:hypothetical protein